MTMTMTRNPNLNLIKVTPSFDSGSGIFDALSSLPYVSNAALSLNLDYYLNRSGYKAVSPLVSHLIDSDTQTLSAESLTKLAGIITARFTNKWGILWTEYTSTSPFFNNVNLSTSSNNTKTSESSGSSTLSKSGSETHTKNGTEEVEDSFPTARRTTRTIAGGWTDEKDGTSTRTGTENTDESFPTARTSTKTIAGGYADTDTTTTTRTGSESSSDTGITTASVFGFNSANAVKASTSEPNTQSQTTYNNVADTRSGSVTRSYNNMSETTSEAGSRRVSTSYGEDGLIDTDDSTSTRTYNNYSDTVEETGTHRKTTSYGNSGLTDELSFNSRADSTTTSSSDSTTDSGSSTESGYNYRRLTDKVDVLQLLYTDPMINNFYEAVYEDIDSVLTCPYYTS